MQPLQLVLHWCYINHALRFNTISAGFKLSRRWHVWELFLPGLYHTVQGTNAQASPNRRVHSCCLVYRHPLHGAGTIPNPGPSTPTSEPVAALAEPSPHGLLARVCRGNAGHSRSNIPRVCHQFDHVLSGGCRGVRQGDGRLKFASNRERRALVCERLCINHFRHFPLWNLFVKL